MMRCIVNMINPCIPIIRRQIMSMQEIDLKRKSKNIYLL